MRPALETMQTLPGVENYMQWQERMREAGALGGKSDEEIADLYLTEQRQRPGWRTFLDNISSNLLAGAHDLVGGLSGTIAFISGSQMMAEYSADKTAEAQRATGALQHTGNGGFVDGVIGGAASGGTLSIAQGVGSAYTDVYAHHIANGMSHEQAAQAASRAAILSGVISAVVSKIPGMRAGAGQIAPQAVRAEMQGVTRAVLSAAAKKGVPMTQGAAEGMAEEFIEGALQHFNTGLHKNIPLEQLAREYLDQLPQSLATSGVMGGGQAGMGRNHPRPGGGQGVPAGRDIPDTATPGMQRQEPGAPRLQFSQGGKSNDGQRLKSDNDIVKAHQDLADLDGAFQLGKDKENTASKGLHGSLSALAEAYSQPGMELGVELLGGQLIPGESPVFQITTPNGVAGFMTDLEHKTLTVDTSDLRSDSGKSGGGSNVYQLALTYALQNGLKLVPDTLVKPKAQDRRTSQMISSVLRHGTTDHIDGLATYKDAVTKEVKTDIPGWKPGDHDHNLALLLRKERDYVTREAGRLGIDLSRLTHDPKTDTIIDGNTRSPLSRATLKSLVDRFKSGDSGVGQTTLLRALVTGSALQGSGSEDGVRPLYENSGGNPGGVGIGGSDRELVSVAWHLYYSQAQGDPGGVPARRLGDTLSERPDGLATTVAETFRRLQEKQPGLINDNTQVFHSADDLINSDYAKQHPFTEAEKAAMRGAEGFFDASTGKTVIIAGNVGLRDGETPQSALTRVVLHERVGHDGLKLLLDAPDRSNGRPGINRARWDDIRRSISDDDLKAIGREEGYQHLQDNPEALALEWFARKAESSPELLKQDTVLRQMWQKFTEMVQDVRAHLGMDPLKGADLDTQVKALLSRARQAAVKGGGAHAGANTGGGGKGVGAAGANSGAPVSPNAAASYASVSGRPGANAGTTPTTGTSSLARAPLDVEGSKRLIANVRANAARRALHPVEQADLDQAERIVAQARSAPPQPPASPARPPLDVAGSRRLIANVRAMPERQRQHPTVQAHLAEALRVVAQAGMA